MSKKNKAEDLNEVVSENQNNTQEQGETAREEEAMGTDNGSTDKEAALLEEIAKEKDKFLRLFAEFENYKKRTSKERMDLFRTAGQEVIVSLLPILDDFERALKEISRAEDQELYTGVALIQSKLKETLKSKGLQDIEIEEGDAFDAEVHDAITQVPAPNKKLKGKIIDVVEKGFRLGDKIIRHPKVVVGT